MPVEHPLLQKVDTASGYVYWFREENEQWPGMATSIRIKPETVGKKQSKFQEIIWGESTEHGRVLILDGCIQCVENDEHAYQEMITNLAMMSHPNPRKVLVVGGGDGGVLREIFKHPSVEQADLCEIDEDVIKISRECLPGMAAGLDNPKANVFIDNGMEFVKRKKNEYDVIITDSSDPVGPAKALFEAPYFQDLYNALTEGGVISSQGSESFWNNLEFVEDLKKTCKQIFPVVEWGWANTPTYPSGSIGFLIATKDPSRDVKHPVRSWTAQEEEKYLKYYNKDIHSASQAGLSCTYDAIPQKKGPKGSRAKVISELRETQKQTEIKNGGYTIRSPPGSPSYTPSPGILTPDLIDACADFFFAHMYHTTPILDQDQFRSIVRGIDQSIEGYCLVAALCAFMLIQPGIALHFHSLMEEPSGSVTNPKMGAALMEECRRVRNAIRYKENPTIHTIITSFFLFGCCFGLNKHNIGWHDLREATALAHNLDMQDESTYHQYGDAAESARNRRLFWLLFVTERAYALQKHKPLDLHATIDLPTIGRDGSSSIAGFIYLVKLYRPFDDTFIGLWNKTRNDCSASWIAQLQQQLTNALPDVLDTTESQAADLRTSQQWLRTMVWQLSITNGFLSSTSQDASMTFKYPIEIARDLVDDTSRLSVQSMEVHGKGLIFDVACTLVDVMSCVPNLPSDGAGSQHYLHQLLSLISTLRGGEGRFLPLIIAKIRDSLPAIATQLPPALVSRAAVGIGVGGPAFGQLGAIQGLAQMTGYNGLSGAVMKGINTTMGGEVYIKQETSSNSSGTLSAAVSDGGVLTARRLSCTIILWHEG
ncbi:uncharacterized protein KY384_008277 [Bacidia gigantensis]|uniref:uncharacterized protein n=1 Tax=Bacidia gigantensis TaxID=2732470 RepID=UPI001D043BC0|nr:uncharacterized protein KY384_008277 [Bacidia gigantensis]KAG8526848.1 hypothetical protein KY384_008277 [Bacidia gigantensis]